MKILIIDDSKNGALALQLKLLDQGYEDVLIAYSASEGINILDNQSSDNPIQLVLMDICMPEMDGIEATRLLKAHDTHKEIPVVMVSGDEDIERLNQAFQAGALDFIRKSAEETELIARVRSALRLKREMEQRKAREKELQELSENYKAKAIEAQEANRSKSQFLANMSHEIRTPMNAIVGMTNLAINENTSPKVDRFLKTVQDSAKLLLALLNDILDLSHIESGKFNMEFTTFSIRQAMEQSATIFAAKAFDNDIELILNVDSQIPERLIGDPHRFSQILNNLLSNAIKFTSKGYISINARLIEQNKNQIKIQFNVKDTGVGIDQVNYEKLFHSFTQADSSTTRKYGGTGLGLTICKNLVEMMNGNIWIESKVGEGSQFIFTSCFDIAKSQPEEKQWFPEESFLKLNILVLDDNPEAGNALIHILESIGLSGKLFHKELMLMDYLNDTENESVDLIFIDNTFPDSDGLTIAKSIRCNLSSQQPEFILMCSLGMNLPHHLIHTSGIRVVVNKPLLQQSVVDSIIRAIKPDLIEGKQQNEKNKIVSYEDLNVLLVEDNDINITVEVETLNSANIKMVETAKNGREAFEMMKKTYQSNKWYDLVLMDVQMPVMDGLQATKKIRDYESSLLSMSNQQMKRSLIIAMTAHAMAGDREMCLEAGMDDYISKPIDGESLFKIIDKWLPTKRKIDNTRRENTIVSENPQKHIINRTVLNIDEAIKRLSGKKELFYQLLNHFVDEYHDVDNVIQKAIDEKDYKTAHRLAHTIKGLASNLSASSLRNVALELEQALKHDKLDNIKVLFENFQIKLKDLFSEITQINNQKTIQPKNNDDNEFSSDTQNELSQLPQIAEINIQQAIQRFAGNIDLFMQVLKRFYQDYQNYTISVREAFSSQNMEKVRQKAHTLKGVASYLASDSLLDAAKKLEIYVIEKRYEKIQAILSTIDDIISKIINSAQRVLQKENFVNEKILTLPQHIQDRFLSISTLLKESDSEIKDVIHDFENTLNQFSLPFSAKRYLKKMVKEINAYQFDNAKKTFKLLADNCNIKVEDKEVLS